MAKLSSKVRPADCLTDPIGPHRHVILAFIITMTLIALVLGLVMARQ